jgi:signal peptidase I
VRLEGQGDLLEPGSGPIVKSKDSKKQIKLIVIAVVIVAIILFVIFIGPMLGHDGSMLVESDSMQHSDDGGQGGIMDQGDTVFYDYIDGRSDVTTYMQGKRQNYRVYGGYGDILIYYKNGFKDSTRVPHRAILWLEYNASGSHERNGVTYEGSFDIPELKNHDEGPNENDAWQDLSGNHRWYNLSGSIILRNIGWDKQDVTIHLQKILETYYYNTDIEPHSGFITLGDHNKGRIDQEMLPAPDGRVRPVQPQWVLGKVTYLIDG